MMKKVLFYILIFVTTFYSCKRDFKNENLITEQFKIEFLNDILSDTTDLKIIKSKDQLISNKARLIPPMYFSFKNEMLYSIENFNHIKFISDTLNINDTIFVKNQFKSNKKLSLNQLTEFGFRIFDMESAINKESKNINYSLHKEIDSLNKGKNSYDLLSITKPIFNKELNLVYIRLGQGLGGKTLILEKKNEKWQIKDSFGVWYE